MIKEMFSHMEHSMNEKYQIRKTYLKWSSYQIQLKNYKF